MVSIPRLQSVNPRIAAIGGGACALIVAAGIVLMPSGMLEELVWTSGVAALVPAAQPPLGITARAVLAIAAGGLAGAVGWSVLYLLFGPGGFLVGTVRRDRTGDSLPVVRRADAHPDAPPRRPICAADLGTPLMDGPFVERPLPTNLEQPLAAFDPAAIPAAPRSPMPPVAPLPRPQPDARIETFALPAIAVTVPPVSESPECPPIAPLRAKPEAATPPSIDALLRRLEQGARAREAMR